MPSASVKNQQYRLNMDPVTLVGCDGGSVQVGFYVAKYSKIIGDLLNLESRTAELEMVTRYLEHIEAPLPFDKTRPDFVIPPEVAMDLMLVSDFLDI